MHVELASTALAHAAGSIMFSNVAFIVGPLWI